MANLCAFLQKIYQVQKILHNNFLKQQLIKVCNLCFYLETILDSSLDINYNDSVSSI